MAKVALINPDYFEDIFSQSKVKAAISRGTMPLGLLCIAAPLIADGHTVKLLNLNLAKDVDRYLETEIKEFKPDVVGITSTTPLINKSYQLSSAIKQIDQNIIVLAGGPHPSALPMEILQESSIDCVVKGEGDLIVNMIANQGISEEIPNIFFNQNGEIKKSINQDHYIANLDELPFPAYELLNIEDYYQPEISSRKRPLGYIETSRGCFARCIYCNKNIHGYKVRYKSPLRVVDEMERMLNMGFKELHIIDDIFTANQERAYAICEEILKRSLKFPWYPRGGIRVDTVNPELFKIMKMAGCYRIPFGIESGSQRIIDHVRKKFKIEQAENAVKMAKQAGLETECYFMLGLPTQTPEDIEDSIDFAIKLDPDYTKFAITIPLPGTKMFDDMDAKGQIKTREWEKYNFSISPKDIYDHDTLSWEEIDYYYNISHRKFYFRIRYVFRMIVKTILNGSFLGHLKAFFQTKWW